jgi:PAS domain S-box-containing protein
MSRQDEPRSDSAKLRKRAEKLASADKPQSQETRAPEEAARTLQELRVHQIELQMQNEELRRAQVELDTARARYFDLYDLAPVGYVTVSERGLILEANLTAARLLGLERGALVKRRLTEFILREDEDIYYLQRKRLLETGLQQVSEVRMARPDGAQFWARVEAAKAGGAEGAQVLRVVIIDITDRKQAETELSASKERLAAIIESAMDAIITLDADQHIVVFNKAAETIFGCAAAEAIGHPLDRFIPARFREAHRRYVQHFGATGATSRSMYSPSTLHGLRANGEEFPLEATISRVTVGGEKLYTVILRDITERKQAEQEILRGKEILEKFIEYAPASLAMFDRNMRYVMASKRWLKDTGIDRHTVVGMSHYEVFPDLPEHWKEAHRRGLAGEMLTAEEDWQALDGKTHTIRWEIHPWGGPGTEIGGIIIFMDDVTERKQTEEVLVRSEKLAAVGRMSATIAHEINNPLEAMTNLVYLLGQSVTEASARDYIDLLDKQVRTLSRLATQTLKFHRDSGRPTKFKLAELIGELLEFYGPKAKKHGVTLAGRFNAEGEITASIGEIRQVISNLLINAIEATPQDGKVTVHVYKSADRREKGPSGYRISVADSGAGIDPKYRARLFEPFFTTKGEEGTGLGLWVSMGIVSRAGGFMRLRSSQRPGSSGTCFSLFLPATTAAFENSGRRRSVAPPSQ